VHCEDSAVLNAATARTLQQDATRQAKALIEANPDGPRNPEESKEFEGVQKKVSNSAALFRSKFVIASQKLSELFESHPAGPTHGLGVDTEGNVMVESIRKALRSAGIAPFYDNLVGGIVERKYRPTLDKISSAQAALEAEESGRDRELAQLRTQVDKLAADRKRLEESLLSERTERQKMFATIDGHIEAKIKSYRVVEGTQATAEWPRVGEKRRASGEWETSDNKRKVEAVESKVRSVDIKVSGLERAFEGLEEHVKDSDNDVESIKSNYAALSTLVRPPFSFILLLSTERLHLFLTFFQLSNLEMRIARYARGASVSRASERVSPLYLSLVTV
jgi:hypothetical protein